MEATRIITAYSGQYRGWYSVVNEAVSGVNLHETRRYRTSREAWDAAVAWAASAGREVLTRNYP